MRIVVGRVVTAVVCMAACDAAVNALVLVAAVVASEGGICIVAGDACVCVSITASIKPACSNGGRVMLRRVASSAAASAASATVVTGGAGAGSRPAPGAKKNASASTAIIPAAIAPILTGFLLNKACILTHPNPSEK